MGYYGGSPKNVLKAPVNEILAIIDFEQFEQDYETNFKALNEDNK